MAEMKAGKKVTNGTNLRFSETNRPLSDAEKAERKKRAKLKNEANMRAQHRRDKQFLEDFKNADENDDMIRGNLIGKHADDTRSISQYGTDAQAGRSFGQKTRGKVAKMEAGGEVPSKYKGFSKLPERVQRNMDSDLAQKYEYGGEVGGSCRGGGAALRGTKFSGCK